MAIVRTFLVLSFACNVDKSYALMSMPMKEKENGLFSCDEAASEFDVAMACMVQAVYDFPIIGTAVPGWDLASKLKCSDGLIGSDKLNIYKKSGEENPTCVFVISGSDDGMDWVEDFSAFPKEACGMTLHEGFYNEMSRLVNEPQWLDMKNMLVTECSKVYVAGHSLGGAVASTFATCAAAGTEPQLEGLKIDGLYTFGAPGIAQGEAPSDGGNCFAGKRFFNLGALGGDPVPAVTDAIGYKHPKMKAVQLDDGAFVDLTVTELPCEDADTSSSPHFGIIPRIEYHLPTFYINRVKKRPDLTLSEPPCYNNSVCRDLTGSCCGAEVLTVKCADGYEPEITGNCGVLGARTSFTCRLKVYDDSMCDGIIGDKCCGVNGVSVNCKHGYEVVEIGTCGLVDGRTKFTCKAPPQDESKCDSGLADACCGIKGISVNCKDGYEVVETGTCGVLGARTKYTCKPVCLVPTPAPTPAPAVTTYAVSSSCACSVGEKILEVDSCKAAASDLGVAFRKTVTWKVHATGCVSRPNGLFFNDHATGGCTNFAKAVCSST